MGKFVSTALTILFFIWIINGCGSCLGCDGCNGCSDCSDPVYTGTITLNIHTWDDETIVAKGNRESGKKNCIYNSTGDYTTYGNYKPDTRIGYQFNGLYYLDGSRMIYLMDYEGYIDYYNLTRIKDKSTIEVYESWNKKSYTVYYALNSNQEYTLSYGYSIENAILYDMSIESFFNQELNDRKTVTGYTAYYIDVNNQLKEFAWKFEGTFNETIIKHYDDILYTQPDAIFVKQNFVSDTVKVEFNYNYPNKQTKTITVGYDEDLNKYFTDEINDSTIEFLGWYLDANFTTKVPAEISKEFESTPLKLFAKYSEYKTIYIDLQDGTTPVAARIYTDGTLSISIEKEGKIFYGLSSQPTSPTNFSKLAYSAIINGQTYYATYINLSK